MAKKQTEADFKAHCESTYGNYTATDSKFFNLRNSGYNGPIDQNGNAVDNPMPPRKR